MQVQTRGEFGGLGIEVTIPGGRRRHLRRHHRRLERAGHPHVHHPRRLHDHHHRHRRNRRRPNRRQRACAGRPLPEHHLDPRPGKRPNQQRRRELHLLPGLRQRRPLLRPAPSPSITRSREPRWPVPTSRRAGTAKKPEMCVSRVGDGVKAVARRLCADAKEQTWSGLGATRSGLRLSSIREKYSRKTAAARVGRVKRMKRPSPGSKIRSTINSPISQLVNPVNPSSEP